jgi:hypothetical protein
MDIYVRSTHCRNKLGKTVVRKPEKIDKLGDTGIDGKDIKYDIKTGCKAWTGFS